MPHWNWIWHEKAADDYSVELAKLSDARTEFEEHVRSEGEDPARYPIFEAPKALDAILDGCREYGDHLRDRHPKAWSPVRAIPLDWWPRSGLFIFYAKVEKYELALLHLHPIRKSGNRIPPIPDEQWEEAANRLMEGWGIAIAAPESHA